MVEDESKKDPFSREGETPGYISLDQARVLAMRTARETPGAYGRRFRRAPMFFEVVGDTETEDHYVVTLSLRPEGDFEGTPGQEQFFFEKEGAVAHRQVLSLPRTTKRRIPLVPVGIGVAVVAAIAVVLTTIVVGDKGDDSEPGVADNPTPVPATVVTPTRPTVTTPPTATRPPTATPIPESPEVRVVTPVSPAGFRLSVAGSPVGPGQDAVSVANGMVYLSEPPNDQGVYPEVLEVTLKASPHSDGSQVLWSGVDFQQDTLAGVSMGADRYVEVEILPPVTSSFPELPDDHGDSFDTATEIFPGFTTGAIDAPFDLDLFVFFC